MVDLAEIQAAYYMVAATGVLIAAIFYIINLREQRRNMKITLETRRIGLIQNLSSRVVSEEGSKRWFDLMNYEWTDYADFDSKYGSENNTEAAAKRAAQFNHYNTIGMMLRRKFVDVEELHDMNMQSCLMFWEKYRIVVEEMRRRYLGREYCRDMEYLAIEMLKYMQSRDPSFKIPEKLDKFDPNK